MKEMPEKIKKIIQEVEQDGGEVLSVYKEPFAGKWQLFVKIPISLVKPTPYQRDLSKSHIDRLKVVIEAVGRYLDPVILVRIKDGEYWIPNGNHRREAMIKCGKKWITGILIPDIDVAYQILALNTEKAHNLREKSLEVIRMYRALMEEDKGRKETDYSFQFEEACLITLGLLYEKNPKFAGGAYHSFLKRVDDFLDTSLESAYIERQKRNQLLEEIDRIVSGIVSKLKQKGINHPFVKNFVVSRCQPLGRKRKIEVTFEEVIEKLKQNLLNFNITSFSISSITGTGDEV